MELFRSIAAFLVVLGVLVFVHEMGHYLAARWRGIHVEAFSIGFGRALVQWTDRLGTVWKISWLPLGGYVKLHGQEQPADATPEERAAWISGRTFHEKSVLSRAIVVAAGPIANFLLAIVLFAVLFGVVGRPESVPVFSDVVAGGPAAVAQLQKGDRVLSIAGTTVRRFEDIRRLVAEAPDRVVDIALERDGVQMVVPVRVGVKQQGGGRIGFLGVAGAQGDFQKMGPIDAVGAGVAQTWDVMAQTLQSFGQMLSGARGSEELGGPLRIAEMSGQVAQLGAASLVSFIALLSINLGLINLFPIPILDGGHLVFYAIEALLGRPLPARAQRVGFRAGAALLGTLFIFATWNDLTHLGLFRWVAHLMG